MFNKVIYKGTEILNVSNDTVVAEALHAGYTAHNGNGAPITGVAKTYEEGYAAGQAAGGGGGASDPATEAVMALLSRCHNNIAGDWTSNPPDGVFVCGGDSQNPTFCIIPPNITDIYGYGFLSSVITLGGLGTIILSLPSAPPFPRSDSLVSDSSHRPEAIYVPDGSVDTYKAAEQWSEFADLIKPMSKIGKITFSIQDVEYIAKEGMTWGEWVNSEYYNATSEVYITPDGYVESGAHGYVITTIDPETGSPSGAISSDDYIYDGERYYQT